MTDNVFWPLQRPEDIPKNQTNWPTFAPPQWQTFTPPLTTMNELIRVKGVAEERHLRQ